MSNKIQRESSGYTLDVLKNQLRLGDAVETTPRGDEYVVSDTVAPNSPSRVAHPDVVSECGLSELPSSMHSDDETEHLASFVQTCVEEVENVDYAAPQKPLLSMRGQEPLDEGLDPWSRLREYVDSKRRLVAKKLSYARPTRRSWLLKQGSVRDILQLKEDLEQKITTWQREVDLKLIQSPGVPMLGPKRRMNSQRNVYAQLLECAYVVTDHLTLANGTFSTPIKG